MAFRWTGDRLSRHGGRVSIVLALLLGVFAGTPGWAATVERIDVSDDTVVIRFDDAVRRPIPAPPPTEVCGIVAGSPQMMKLLRELERIAPATTSVLIVGESGTGKEKVAEALHERSVLHRECDKSIPTSGFRNPSAAKSAH